MHDLSGLTYEELKQLRRDFSNASKAPTPTGATTA
jgi:hypothetical protein